MSAVSIWEYMTAVLMLGIVVAAVVAVRTWRRVRSIGERLRTADRLAAQRHGDLLAILTRVVPLPTSVVEEADCGD